MRIPVIKDIIIMKNGDFINANITTKIYAIKTSYGEIQVKKKDVAHIHMKGAQFNKDEVFTLEMNKFTGTLQQKIIEVKLQSGEQIEIRKSKIHTIIILTNRT